MKMRTKEHVRWMKILPLMLWYTSNRLIILMLYVSFTVHLTLYQCFVVILVNLMYLYLYQLSVETIVKFIFNLCKSIPSKNLFKKLWSIFRFFCWLFYTLNEKITFAFFTLLSHALKITTTSYLLILFSYQK